jgi:glycosyltransferase involved in cell wall biosynthesis
VNRASEPALVPAAAPVPAPGAGGVRLGFACVWDPDAPRTWSHTPWNLREALRARTEVADLGVQLPRPARLGLQLAHARRSGGRLVSPWKHSTAFNAIARTVLAGSARRTAVDAVLEVQDLAVLDVPFFVYQDLSYDVLLGAWEADAATVPHFPALDRARVQARRERQLRVYERAAGVLAMSGWFARSLVDDTGLPASKVHVVHPGATARAAVPGPLPVREAPRTRLLLVGRDFHTKGGDLVVAALEILRREHDPRVTLTVAGPDGWPLPGGIPDGVRFLGRIPAERVARLYDTHDLLVMPSRLEGFGIVFAEALARGLPCVGRSAFAMPEIIGRNGALVRGDDPAELATVVARVLADDAMYETCLAAADEVAAHYTWERAAGEVLTAVTGTLEGASR